MGRLWGRDLAWLSLTKTRPPKKSHKENLNPKGLVNPRLGKGLGSGGLGPTGKQQIMEQMLQDVIVWHAFGVRLRYPSKADYPVSSPARS